MGLLKFNLCIFFPALWLSLQPRLSVSPQTAGSIHLASQQGWSLSSNKPLSHRLMPADDNSPSPPSNGSDQLSAWLNPKGETERVTQQESERGKEGQRRKKNSFFSFITPFLGSHPSTGHDSPVLTSLPLSLIFLLSLHLCSFSGSDEKMFATLFVSLTPQSTATKLQIHRTSSLKQRSDHCFFLYFQLHFLDFCMFRSISWICLLTWRVIKTWNSLRWFFLQHKEPSRSNPSKIMACIFHGKVLKRILLRDSKYFQKEKIHNPPLGDLKMEIIWKIL